MRSSYLLPLDEPQTCVDCGGHIPPRVLACQVAKCGRARQGVAVNLKNLLRFFSGEDVDFGGGGARRPSAHKNYNDPERTRLDNARARRARKAAERSAR